jgi:hypothetical protein
MPQFLRVKPKIQNDDEAWNNRNWCRGQRSNSGYYSSSIIGSNVMWFTWNYHMSHVIIICFIYLYISLPVQFLKHHYLQYIYYSNMTLQRNYTLFWWKVKLNMCMLIYIQACFYYSLTYTCFSEIFQIKENC